MTLHFDYVAVDQGGTEVAGSLEASSKKDATVKLSKMSLTVLQLSLVAGESEDESSGGSIRVQDIVIAFYELASMLNAGVSAAEAVAAQAQSAAHSKLRQGFKAASKTLRHGGSFEQAIVASGFSLPDYVFYLIKAGELSGKLGEALSDVCSQMQYDMEVRNDTRNALIYPVILVVSGVLAVLMMFVYVVPSFSNLLDESENLPFLAWAVLSSGKWSNENFLLLIVLLAIVPVTVAVAWANKTSRERVLQFIEKLPLVGEWIVHADVASWSRVLSSLVRNRVELTLALDLAAESVRMPARKKRLLKVKSDVRGGETLSAALENNQCLTETGYNLVRVGERAGKLGTMLETLAKLYANQSQERMKKVLALIEPVAILLIGVTMGVIIIGVMLAITSANDIPL